MKQAARLIACGWIGLVCVSGRAGEIQVAGRLAVDIHAELLVAIDGQGHALNWYNCGALWGTFGNFGFDGPKANYPKLGKVGGAEAVIFDGNDRLRLDMKAPASITDKDFSVEVWVHNPSVEQQECLVSWAAPGAAKHGVALGYGLHPKRGVVLHGHGADAGYLCARPPAAGRWHHIVLVWGDGWEKVYVDADLMGKRAVKLDLAPGGTIVLGSDAEGKHGFTGAIAAVRIHERALTGAQVARNHKGGIRLGADLVPNIVARPRGILFADNRKDPNIACRTSKHFRTCWEKDKDAKGDVAKRVPKQLADAERFYEIYAKRLGMHLPIVSDKIANRGDGKKYLIEICNNWGGGNFGGHMPHGFGYPIQGPGFLSGHELAHACQMHCMGSFPGNWWEAHANWMPEQADRPHVHPVLNNLTSMFFMGVGRHYYHCWLIFQHLAETPEYGPLFVAKMWHECKRGEYLWNVAERIDPDPTTPFADEWVKMARRNVTWDYQRHDRYVTANDHPDMNRLGRTLLEPIPLEAGWYRVPREMAPQQFGYNLCPLKPTGREVTVDLRGYVNPERGSDWRACLVAVGKAGRPRYGSIWRQGKGSLTLRAEEAELYLVVAATPTKVVDIPMTGDYRSPAQHPFPYKVALTGAEPLDVLIPKKPAVPGRAHPNGGGFVAKTAAVDPTAYVGPRAQVLDRAKVLGRARIEGFAVVRGKAVVGDHATVSGHALVEGDAVVRDHAKVRGWAKVAGRSTVRDFAKVLEHGLVTTRGKEVSGFAVVKGAAAVRGNVGGSAMVDGSFSKSNDLTRGVWFTWNWGGGHNPGEIDEDLGGLYADYRFEKAHPYLAWDTYGATHAYLVGGPKLVVDEQRAKYKPPADEAKDVTGLELTGPWRTDPVHWDDHYGSLIFGYLHPPVTGDYTFWIAADDTAELWLSTDEGPANRRKTAWNGRPTGLRQWDRFGSQKSAPVRLEAGKAYYVEVPHKAAGGGDFMAVAWQVPGKKRTVVPGSCLSKKPRGPRGGPQCWIWKGIRGGQVRQLTDSSRFARRAIRLRGGALELNGRDQYVELPRDVADMRDITVDVELKWDGGAKGQRIFEFAADEANRMYLTPADTGGNLRFVIRKDGNEQALKSKAALPTGRWTRVQVMLSEDTGRLYVDGAPVDTNDRMTLNPDDLRARVCLLGRGLGGGFFKGRLDRVSLYANSLVDDVPPSPDPAEWAWKPMLVSGSEAVMRAATGKDPRGKVEYFFEETSRRAGGDDSGWQKAPTYRDAGLKPGATYAYRVKMRDVNGNVTRPSRAVTVQWANPPAFVQGGGAAGLVVIEAEHFHLKTAAPDGHQWKLNTRRKGYSGDGVMESTPNNGANRMTDYPEQSPRLDYFVKFVRKGRHWLWVRSFGPHYTADSIHVALDFRREPWGEHVSTGWGAYKWVRTKPFRVETAGTHRLSVWMREDGVMVDKIVLTTEAGYKPSEKLDPFNVPIGPGPAESPRLRQGGARQPRP